MYVCVCHAVTERQVQEAIGDGAVTVRQLKDRLQVSTSCGNCAGCVEECLNGVLVREMGGMLPDAAGV